MECPKCRFENPANTAFCGKCGTKFDTDVGPTKTLETPMEELTTGSTFAGRYQIIEELGKGGMGRVYKALDKETKERIALKLIKPEIASDKKTIERFRNELTTARKIAHRNVCRMYDLNREEGSHYITMEFVSGGDLKKLIRRTKRLDTGTALSIAKQICEGLSEAHRLGIVHRDLKPNNIMIDDEGNARIMDFGIARTVKKKGITGSGIMIGTPEYMSPEQAEARDIDQRSDIYSLGVILYEMTTGRLPFEGETSLAVAMKHKGEIPANPKEFNPQIPDDLSGVILKCLKKEKEERYQSAENLRTDLERIEQGLPTTDRIVSQKKPLTSREITVQLNIKKLLVPVLAVTAVLIIGLFLWRPWAKQTAAPLSSDKPSIAVPYFENNTGDASLEYLRSGLSEWIIIDISQSKYLHVLSGDKIFSILKKLNLLDANKLSTEDLEKIAEQGRVDHVLKGSFIKIGENFVLTAMLQKPQTGEVISSFETRCRGEEEIPGKVDELTKRIKADLNLTRQQIESDIDREVGKITTSSPEAFKHYMEGWKHHIQFEYSQSSEYMQKAIAEDPDFAMAYRTLSWAYRWRGMFPEQRETLRKAYELKDRASARERYLIEGDYFQVVEKDLGKAIASYEALLEIYPEDILGNFNLAQVYIEQLEEYDKAIPLLEVLVENREEAIWIYTYLGNAYTAEGMYDKVDELYRFYLDNFPEDMRIRTGLALNYIYLGEYDRVMTEYEKVMATRPEKYGLNIMRSRIEILKGNLDRAEEELRQMLEYENPEIQTQGIFILILLYFMQGRFEDSEKLIEEAEKLIGTLQQSVFYSWFYHKNRANIYYKTGKYRESLAEFERSLELAVEMEVLLYQIEALEGKGAAYLKLKEFDKALNAAGELKELVEKEVNKRYMRFYYHLSGVIELEKESFSTAIDLLERAVALMPEGPQSMKPEFFAPLALAYYRAGDMDRARAEYERITKFSDGMLEHGDVYAKAFYMLGVIYEDMGKKIQAVENYEKFLELWKNADPGLPEVEDSKQRLNALSRN